MSMNIKINPQFDDTKIILQSINSYLALEYAMWTKDKAKIKFTKEMPPFSIINNFIYWCNLGINIGSEQNKIRPVLIAKTKRESSICTVLSLTSERINDTRWYHIDLENQPSTVLIEQLRNVSKLRILMPFRVKGKLIKITFND